MNNDENEKMTKFLITFPEYQQTRILRLKSLYSDYSRLKINNESGYKANNEWWKKVLKKGIEDNVITTGIHGLLIEFNENLIQKFYFKDVNIPLNLGDSVGSLIHEGYLKSVNDDVTKSNSRITNAVNVPLEWLFSTLGLSDNNKEYDIDNGQKLLEKHKGTYFITSRLNIFIDKINSDHLDLNLVNRLYNTRLFSYKYDLKGYEYESVINELIKRKNIIIDNNINVIKVVNSSDNSSTINEIDIGVVNLKNTIHLVKIKIKELENLLNESKTSIQQLINEKNINKAKHKLKSKKGLEVLLEKQFGNLMNVEDVLYRIDQSVDDIQMMKVYENSNQTLSKLLSSKELNRDNVEDTLDSLNQTLEDQKEIHEIVNDSHHKDEEIEEEIEDEFNQLFKENEREKEEHQKLQREQQGEKEESQNTMIDKEENKEKVNKEKELIIENV